MSCSPLELNEKCAGFMAKWHSFEQSPGFDDFVEFAVAASSITEFMHRKGLSGLHQSAHALEQKVLSVFDAWTNGTMPEPTFAALKSQTIEFGTRVAKFLDGNTSVSADRRSQPESDIATDLIPHKMVWLLTPQPATWGDLITQLGYFSIQVNLGQGPEDLSGAHEPSIVLIDALGMRMPAFVRTIKALRGRFSTSNLVALNLSPDFESLNLALGAGCDYCLTVGTAHSAIIARVAKLCDSEQESVYRVLVVEDSKTASAMIQRTLSESGMESMAVHRPQEVLTALANFNPDLILMDMFMPGCTGVEVTRVIRQNDAFLSTPVVYLSADTNVALQVDALRLGGDHFLTKPFNPVILNAVVRSKIDRYRTLRKSMILDSLTGLLNHTASKQRLAAAVGVAQREGAPVCAAMVDIDHFKKVNDTYGHPVGDQVIRSIAWLLKQRLRKTDIVGRYGGEEFVVILPGSQLEQGMGLLDSIRADFGRVLHPYHDTTFACSFSAGVAQWMPSLNAESLLKQADDALYQAKRAGRNQVSSRM
jgi:diguanylate cyclase (GGDEF)-like protein